MDEIDLTDKLEAEKKKFRDGLCWVLAKLDNSKVWAGTKWQYNGVGSTRQKQVTDRIEEILNKGDK